MTAQRVHGGQDYNVKYCVLELPYFQSNLRLHRFVFLRRKCIFLYRLQIYMSSTCQAYQFILHVNKSYEHHTSLY